ncbi:MAG: UvrD-helicase domain-containing protein [Acidithiobacillus sp.]|nr:UvrD-helicase domain-containing protein [Acidithiobacillus thiooxidans]MDA8154586.1 UvrD-helicase domain-containing protein [Acidithiobacillus sp.]
MTASAPALQSKSNPQQLEAILTTEGPVLIIAGPGSGKTFTLVERIVYLITQKGVAPESLFVVTFTDKAARELTTRISNRLTDLDIKFNLNEMYLGTFHSGDESIPQAENPNLRAENKVVPRPQNGSSTTAFSFRCLASTRFGYSSGTIVK